MTTTPLRASPYRVKATEPIDADDILLLAPSIRELEKLLRICEN